MESSSHGNPATHKYKLLQLRQHFSREAKKVVEPLEYSAAGYEAGSTETQIWRRGKKNSLTIRRTGKETGRYEELGKGTLYINLCKRLNEAMLTQYNRWHFENNHWELVETLKEFVLREAEFQTVASETRN